MWYCQRIEGILFRQVGVDVYSEFAVRRAIYGGFRHHQFPQPILFCDGQNRIIFKDVLGGGDDLYPPWYSYSYRRNGRLRHIAGSSRIGS